MIDSAEILFRYGLAAEPAPVSVAVLDTAAAERSRVVLLERLDEATAGIGMLKLIATYHPHNPAAVQRCVDALRAALDEADAALRGLAETIACRGEA